MEGEGWGQGREMGDVAQQLQGFVWGHEKCGADSGDACTTQLSATGQLLTSKQLKG